MDTDGSDYHSSHLICHLFVKAYLRCCKSGADMRFWRSFERFDDSNRRTVKGAFYLVNDNLYHYYGGVFAALRLRFPPRRPRFPLPALRGSKPLLKRAMPMLRLRAGFWSSMTGCSLPS